MKRTIQWMVVATSTVGAAMLALGAAGCEHDPQATAELECQILCPCEGSAADQATCLAQCPGEIAGFSEACQNCIFENSTSCSTLEVSCQMACEQQTGGGGGSGSGSGGSSALEACQLGCSCEGSNEPANCVTDCTSAITPSCTSCVLADGTCSAAANCAGSCN